MTAHTPAAMPLNAGTPAELAPGQGAGFVDRRRSNTGNSGGVERRQFASSHLDLSPAARELAVAIDGYKARNRRRYITFEEMLQIIEQLGYRKS